MSWLMRHPDGAGIPEVVGVAWTDNRTNASFTVALPSGWQAGDLFIMYTLGNNTASTTVPSGWSLYGTFLTTGGGRVNIHTRTAASGDTAPTVTFPSSSAFRVLAMAAYRKSSGTPSIASNAFATDFTSPYATTSIASTQAARIALAVAAAPSSFGGDPMSVTIANTTDTIYSPANRGIALTHFDGTTPGTFGTYGLTYSTTIGSTGSRSLFLEIV